MVFMGCASFGPLHTAGAHEGGHGNEIMWSACDNRKINEHCSFENLDHGVYRGTCQSIAHAMVCVRNQPIDYASTATLTPEYGHHLSNTNLEAREAEHRDWRWPWVLGCFAVAFIAALTLFRKTRSLKG